MAFGDTQPLSHCNDLRASSLRFLESSHIGVSGTKHIATIVMIGTPKHIRAAVRHCVTDPNIYTINMPNVTATPAQEIKIPRIDG